MATTYKVLGQAAPASTSSVDLYTVPTSTQTIVSTIVVSNTTATDATCTIYVRVNGAAASAVNTLVKDGTVAANDFTAITVGITLSAGDVLSVSTGTANALTFQAFGSEIA